MLQSLKSWPRYRYIVLFLAAFGAVALSGFLGPDSVLNGWHQDRAVQVSAILNGNGDSVTDQPVVVIAMDRKSMDSALLQDVPRVLMQPFFAETIDAAITAGAKSVAVDFLLGFSARKYDPEGEKKLLSTLRKHRKKVALGRQGPQLPDRRYMLSLASKPTGRLGLMELVPDTDSVVRRINLVYWPGVSRSKQPLPSLAGAALYRAGITDIPDMVTVAPTQHLERIPTYSFADVIQCARTAPDALAAAFADKIVFIGTTMPGEDRKFSAGQYLKANGHAAPRQTENCLIPHNLASDPMSRSVPGVYLHAQAAAQILNGIVPASPSPLILHLLAGLTAMLGALWVLLARPQIAVPGLVGLAALGFLASALALPAFWIPLGVSMFAMALAASGAYGARFWFEQRQKSALADAFSRYVAPQLVNRIMDDRKHLERGGEVRDLSVWIADIANYSTMAEKADPKQTAAMLNRIFGTMADIIEQHDGYVTQYAGDAIVAVFGAFGDTPDHADKAVTCAMASLNAVNEIGAELESQIGARVGLRVGISSDRMLAGNIGSAKRLNFAIVGDGINLSARLESANKLFGTSILISDMTRQRCSDQLCFRLVDQLQVKGRETPLKVYEPLGLTADIPESRQIASQQFAEALDHLWALRLDEAHTLFRKLAEQDPLARLFVDRIAEYRQDPPPPDWDGVYILKNK